MSESPPVQPGIRALIGKHSDWLKNKRVALLSHPAAIDPEGTPSADLLCRQRGCRLVSLLGPEHGYLGHSGAGKPVRSRRHPTLGIPIHSLYGKTPGPTASMLRNVDVIAVDLQDLAVRCYTYVSTLRYVLDAAARLGKTIIIADRPVPFATTLDGPVTQPGFESMVAHVHTPMVYGMTPGESARWIAASYGYDIDLRIARATAYRRNTMRPRYTAGWIPPSPAIASWETAWCYPMTVFTEALPAVDCGRGTRLPFQLIGAPWMKGPELAEHLNGLGLPGILFHPHVYAAPLPPHKDQLLNGVRIAITNPRRLRPVQAGVAIVGALQTLYGKRRLWSRDSRPDFFDRLYGTDEVRIALKDGASHASIARSWQTDLRRFNRSRKQHLLYR